jgi:hypothetical protein
MEALNYILTFASPVIKFRLLQKSQGITLNVIRGFIISIKASIYISAPNYFPTAAVN